jgi:16S rRNA pseudouridine516 synthase
MRLDKYIADSSTFSRREVKGLLKSGKVLVNGVGVKQPETQVKDSDKVNVCGKDIVYQKYIYLMMNKPPGYLSATEDARAPVVTDLLPEDCKRFDIFPAGRLDKDTEGLLILTNDGQFAHAVTSPRKNVCKRYFAILDKPAQPEDVEAFKNGMEFMDFRSLPAVLELTGTPCEVFIEIAEGKFHQVKRMCERVGKQVTYLKRVSIGGLALDVKLGLGESRELSAEELESLKGGASN